MITIDVLTLSACAGATIVRAELHCTPLANAMRRYAIDTTLARAGMFLANVGHESGGLQWLTELWGPTASQLRYEGRMDLGNAQPGDGFRYRGRGFLQTTGRANFRVLRDRLRARWRDLQVPDFEAAPHMVAQPVWAALSAADYWSMRNLNALADAGDFLSVVRKINGGTNGLEDRMRLWNAAQRVLA